MLGVKCLNSVNHGVPLPCRMPAYGRDIRMLADVWNIAADLSATRVPIRRKSGSAGLVGRRIHAAIRVPAQRLHIIQSALDYPRPPTNQAERTDLASQQGRAATHIRESPPHRELQPACADQNSRTLR
ncbi:UNVERIFIED_CONTAM: hypothetical protein DV101_00325 [Bifidobacterium animalis]|nr:hypothetical protein W7Y_0292 [Bifidobacterium animalis subsp. lactis B420]AFJ17613.1 hypothetical protein W91_0301 [Bifidobacterium animalis subsp. lactis Bi-07]AJD33412.1 hypothetical protein BAA6_0299 [Bifidobacterium animalis]AXM94276.1 hypothetical protein CJD49_03505 [Bifidobacterium animalis subsp. lactis]KAB7477727.1 hypothetical protein GBA86_10390 [Bifidobacterium bifidum]PIN32531.1 hypothetical protein CUC13_02365 [Bifidobacterium animalis subsp. lactis BB-12]CDL72084.1 hypothet